MTSWRAEIIVISGGLVVKHVPMKSQINQKLRGRKSCTRNGKHAISFSQMEHNWVVSSDDGQEKRSEKKDQQIKNPSFLPTRKLFIHFLFKGKAQKRKMTNLRKQAKGSFRVSGLTCINSYFFVRLRAEKLVNILKSNLHVYEDLLWLFSHVAAWFVYDNRKIFPKKKKFNWNFSVIISHEEMFRSRVASENSLWHCFAAIAMINSCHRLDPAHDITTGKKAIRTRTL